MLTLNFSLDLSREEVAIAKRYPPQTALCLRDGWEFCKSELAAGMKSRPIVVSFHRGLMVVHNLMISLEVFFIINAQLLEGCLFNQIDILMLALSL